MTKRPVQFSARLAENTDAIGQLLREGLEEPSRFPSESSTWHGLLQKRERSSRRFVTPFGTVLTVVGACAMGLVWWVNHDQGPQRLSANPETLLPTISPSAPNPSQAITAAQPLEERALKSRHWGTTKVEDKAQPSSTIPGNNGAAGTDALAPGDEATESTKNTSVCSEMARSGHLEDAADCYSRIAQGNSMAAELALYEKARLESRALGRGAAALATLDEHANRFPHGVLSTEAGLTRIELLTRLGRTSDALAAIEKALSGPIGKERGGDLYALRGELLSNRGDCAGANTAFALARSQGVPPSRPLAGEKRCANSLTASPTP
jgi:hypothetical protein